MAAHLIRERRRPLPSVCMLVPLGVVPSQCRPIPRAALHLDVSPLVRPSAVGSSKNAGFQFSSHPRYDPLTLQVLRPKNYSGNGSYDLASKSLISRTYGIRASRRSGERERNVGAVHAHSTLLSFCQAS